MLTWTTRAGAFAAALCCVPALARAESTVEEGALSLTLEYTTIAGCPDVGNFKNIVARRLGYDPFRADAPHRVLVLVAPRDSVLEGRLEWRDRSGKWAGDQSFPSSNDDCRELVRTMALALTVQIHLLAVASTPVPPASAETERSARAAPLHAGGNANQPEARATANPAPASKAPPAAAPVSVVASTPATFGVGAGTSLGFGLSSSALPLVRVFALLAWRVASLELAGEAGPPVTTRRADGAGFSQQLSLLAVAGCGALQPWSACLLTKAGVVRVQGRDVDVPASPTGAVVLTGFRVAASPRLGRRTFVSARAEGLAALTRWTVRLDETPVWAAPRFSVGIGFDVGVLFP